MRFLCDVHISFKVKKFLINSGYGCIHINEVLEGDITSDKSMADYRDKHNLILISKDQDFTDSYLLNKKPKKLIKVSLGNISTQQLIQMMQTYLPVIRELFNRDSFMAEFHKHSFQIWED